MKQKIDHDHKLTLPDISKYVHVDSNVETAFNKFKNPNGQTLSEINSNAKVRLRTIDNPSSDLVFSSNYVTKENVDFVKNGLVSYYLDGFGVDIFNLKGIVTVTNPETGEIRTIAPAIAFINENRQTQVIDGHTRCVVAQQEGKQIVIMEIEGIPPEYISKSYPINFSEIKIFDRFPKKNEKKLHRRSGIDPKNIIDFTPLGSGGSRVSELEKNIPFFHENPIIGPKNLAKKMRSDVNQRLKQINIKSPHYEGMFPRALGKEGSISRVETLLDAKKFDDNHIFTTLSVTLKGTDGIERNTTYYPVAKTKEFAKKTSARKIVILESNEKKSQQYQNIPDGEIIIPPQICQELNLELTQKNLRKINDGDKTTHIIGAPFVTGFHFITDASRFHTEAILEIEGGKEVGFMFNRQEQKGETLINGSIFVIRDNKNNIIFVNHYRELFGMTFLELPRMFGFNLDRLKKEIGFDLTNNDLYDISQLSQSRDISTAIATIFSLNLSPETKFTPTKFEANEYPENGIVVSKTDQEIHEIIAKGELHCKLTNAAITRDQISHGILTFNPKFINKKIVLEKFYFEPDRKYYLRPVATPTNPSLRISQNCFSDTGTLLDYDHVEIGDKESLPEDKYYVEVPISEIMTLMTDGTLDSDAIADISTGLRHENILILK